MNPYTRVQWTACLAAIAVWGCSSSGSDTPPGVGAGGTTNPGDTSGQAASDETTGGGDSAYTAGTGGGSGGGINPGDECPDGRCSYIWIANSGESTLSKVNTVTAKEVARYRTCPGTGPFDCDPSRTSVNLHGDVVVTNRYPHDDGGSVNPETVEHSSVTKFAASLSDCVDRNGDGKITTSTGPDDVLPWGEDECMLWYRDLGFPDGKPPRARATAWDGSEDQSTGTGGLVVIGTCIAEKDPWDPANPEPVEWGWGTNYVFLLDGDTGEIVDTIPIPDTECFYGGAMDADGNFWIMDGYGFPNENKGGGLLRVNLATKQVDRFPEKCGYGISVDSNGRVWTGGKSSESDDPPHMVSCIQRFDPQTETAAVSPVFSNNDFLRGIAVGLGKSQGYVWAAERRGSLYKVALDDLSDVQVIPTPAFKANAECTSFDDCSNELVGVAIDFEGNVWTVSTTENAAYKYDPDTNQFTTVPIGEQPYTYSDMTGMQLLGAIIIL